MNLILLQNLGVGRGMKCYQVFSRICCSKELSAIKSSFSQGPLPLKKVLWNIWTSGGYMGRTLSASQKCCVKFLSNSGNWEGKTVTRRWRLKWYPWVFWSIKLSLVNTISGFLRGKCPLSTQFQKSCFLVIMDYIVWFSFFTDKSFLLIPLAGFWRTVVMEASSPCLCFVPNMSRLTVLTRGLWS